MEMNGEDWREEIARRGVVYVEFTQQREPSSTPPTSQHTQQGELYKHRGGAATRLELEAGAPRRILITSSEESILSIQKVRPDACLPEPARANDCVWLATRGDASMDDEW